MPFGLRADDDVIEDQKASMDASAIHHERMAREIEALRAEKDMLRAALKPFADAAGMFSWPVGERDAFLFAKGQGLRLTVGDLRKARDLLATPVTPDKGAV